MKKSKINQLLFKNPIWKIVISHAIPERISTTKVGLSIILTLNSFKSKFDRLKIVLDALVKSRLLVKERSFPTLRHGKKSLFLLVENHPIQIYVQIIKIAIFLELFQQI